MTDKPQRSSDEIIQQILDDFRRSGEENDPWWLIPAGIVFYLILVPLLAAGFLGFFLF